MTGNIIRLHEATQRGICRLAFIVLGLVPLSFCLSLVLMALAPGSARRQAAGWERRLALAVGFTVKIGAVDCRAPFLYRLDNIQFLHPESQRKVGGVSQLELRWERDRWRVSVTEGHMTCEQLWSASRLFHDWHVCRPDTQRPRALFEFERLIIEDNDRSWEMNNVKAELFPDLEKWALKATFDSDLANGQANTQPQNQPPQNQLLVFRNHHPDHSTTEIQLRAESPVPLWLIEPSLESNEQTPMLRSVASGFSKGQFTGVVDARLRSFGPSIYLTNAKIRDIELGHLGSAALPLVSGRGDLVLNQAILDSNGLRWAEGAITAGPGRIDNRFMTSLADHLRMDLIQAGSAEFLGFDQLSVLFRVQPDAIQIIGAAPDGGLIHDAHGPLVSRSDTDAIPMTELIYALASTPKAAAMVRSALVWLPLNEDQRRETSQVLRISRN